MTELRELANPRLNAIFNDVEAALLEIISRHRVTWEEYRTATTWLAEAGTQPFEIPLLLDVFLSPTVDDANHGSTDGTECNVEGPVYIPGAPVLQAPYVLPMRPTEPGEKLVVSGTVRSTDGTPLAGATLDVWQSNAVGEYSQFQPNLPEWNLRGRLSTDADGAFSYTSVVPVPYGIPDGGATGRLMAALGRHCMRPSHLHFKITHPDATALTTQLYFADDPYIDSDVVGAVKASLVTKLDRRVGDDGQPYAACSYDFVLAAA
ncbi:MAG: dioxygenase family protein [Sporichthyaceae bacterium]